MKKLLFLIFTLASISGFAQSPGLFKYLRIGTVTDSTATVGTANGTIYYNPTSGKFRFREGGTWKSIGSGSGSGTVTDVSVVTANGISGSVATSTTTPAITLTLGAITPSSINSSGSITGSSIIKSGGTSSQFLKADGSIDATTYLSTVPGSNTQLIYNNSGALGASANLSYNTSTNTFLAGNGISITGSGTRSDNFYLGLNHTDAISGGGTNKWNFFLGEQNQISNASTTSNKNINDAFLLGSFYNKLSSLSTGGNINTSGIVGSLNSIIETSNDISTSGSTIIGGALNKIAPSHANSTTGLVIGSYVIGGSHNLSDGHGSGASGYWSKSSGTHSFASGFVTTFTGDGWPSADPTYDIDNTNAHTGTIPRILASGKHAFNFSTNSPNQTSGFGALSDYSGILAGRNANIQSGAIGSVALGGYGLNVADSATVMVPYLNLNYAPANDDALTQVLVRDGSTGKVKYRTASSLGGGSGTVNSATANKLAYYAGTGTTVSGLTAITASRALVSDANGLPVAAPGGTTATELGYVNGVTSAIQTQLNGKQASGSYAVTTNNLSDLSSASTARTNLGLGTAALISSTAGGDLSGTLPSPTVTKLNGTSLAGLATGILINTTGTGVPSIATLGTGLSFSSGTLSSTNQRVYNVESYGAVHNGRYLKGGLSTTNGSATVTTTDGATPFVSGDVGKIILIPGAGAAGATLKTTIATFNGTNSVILAATASVSVTGAQSYFGTDDTAAIQAANDAAYTAGGGIVYFPNGFYTINGSLQTSVGGANPNCQLYFQSHSSANNTVSVKWLGESVDMTEQGTTPPQTGVILFSTLTSSSGTNPSVIGTIGFSTNSNNFNYDESILENIGVRVWTNKGTAIPVLSGINFALSGNCSIIRSLICGEYDRTISVNPTGTGFFGIFMPTVNNYQSGKLENVSVRGAFEYGIIHGEHVLINGAGVNGCYYGHVFLRTGHPHIGKILAQSNVTQIYIPSASTFLGFTNTGGIAALNLTLETEINTASQWYDTQYLVRDFGNNAYGKVTFNCSSQANTETLFNTIIVTEAINLNVIKVGSILSNKVNQAGGAITGWGGVGHEPEIEVGSTTAATSGGDYVGVLAMASSQSNATSLIGRLLWLNKSAGSVIGARIQGFTDADVNNYTLRFYAQRASTSTEHFRLDGNITNFVTLKPATGTTSLLPVQFTAGADPTTNVSGGFWTNANNEPKYSTSTTAASGGYFALNRVTSTATSITLSGLHNTVLVTATGQTITLPTAVGKLGRVYTIKLTASGTGTVATTSSELIDGASTFSLTAQYKYVSVQSDNAAWNIIANN